MYFLNPWFLLGLLAVSIPVIIHLFNFRRFKKIYFSNVRFVKSIKEETQKQSKLRHLIIMFLRIFAIACLVIAFAQPFLKKSDTNANAGKVNYVSIYLDNSFSMQAEGKRGILLDEAKIKAAEIVNAYSNSDYFRLLTNDFEAKHLRYVTKDELLDFVKEINLSPVTRNLSDVFTRLKEKNNPNGSGQYSSYIISDFQKNTADISHVSADSLSQNYLIPVASNPNTNLYIDSCWFDSPVHLQGQKASMHIRVVNNSTSLVEKVPLKLTINGAQRAVSSFDMGPNASTDVAISYSENEPGFKQGVLEIVDNPIVFDDKFFFSYTIADKIPVLNIQGSSAANFISLLLQHDSAFDYRSVSQNQIDYASLSKYNLIILNEVNGITSGLIQELQKFCNNGGHLLIIPAAKQSIPELNMLTNALNAGTLGNMISVKQRISWLNLNSDIYKNVFEKAPDNMDLPQVQSYYTLKFGNAASEALLKMQNGDLFLTATNCGKGRVFMMAVPLQTDFSNFPRHALFVPTFYNMALHSNYLDKLYYKIGEENLVAVKDVFEDKGDLVFKISGENSFEIIPGVQRSVGNVNLILNDAITLSGNYKVNYQNHEIQGLSFNYNRKESNLICLSPDEIKSNISQADLKNVQLINDKNKPVSQVIQERNQGKPLWKIFIVLALLLLAAEVLFLRFWK